MTEGSRPLRVELLAAFLGAALVPATLLGGVAAWTTLRDARRAALEHSGELASSLAAEVGRHLDADLLQLREVQASLELARAVGHGGDPHLALHLPLNPALQTLLLLDERGRVGVVEPPDPDLLGTDQSRQPFVTRARARGEPTWSSATLSPRTGRPAVTLVVPGQPWTVVGYLDLEVLRDVVARHRATRAAGVAIVDSDGAILAADDFELVRQRVNVGDVPLVQEGMAGRAATAEVRVLGQEQLASVAPVPLTGWMVLVGQPKEQAYDLVRRIRSYLLLAALMGLLLAALAAVVLGRRILRPIEALADAARAVAAGDYRLRLPHGALRETDALARGFEAMAAAVREREDARARADRHYREVVATPVVAVIRVGHDGVVTFTNGAAARLFGYGAPEELVGRPAVSLYFDPAERAALVAEVARAGRVSNREMVLRRRDGQPVPVLVNISEAEDGLTTVLLDQTEVRRAEVEREKLEEQLRHAQRLEAVGRLAGGVAHDFNNLLTAIVGCASSMADGLPINHPEQENVKEILHAAGRAANLTRSLLAYSRKQVLRPRAVDLRDAMRAVSSLVRRVLGPDVDLSVVLPGEPLVAVVDPGQLEQVLMNLCTNARDAMARGGRLTLAGAAVELRDVPTPDGVPLRPGRYARLSVTDTGQGMSREVRERIFEPFFTTKEQGKGTGLGLAIVYGIVRQHGGHVEVDSEEGAGTTITVLLPLHEGPADPEAEPAPDRTAGARPGEVVLLAEDEPAVRRVVRAALERAGYRVREAADGEEAVARFAESPDDVSVCLFDVMMPRLNGREAGRRVQALRPGVPLLLMSGHAAAAVEAWPIGEAGPDVLAKPVRPAELLDKVRQLLDGRAAAPSAKADALG